MTEKPTSCYINGTSNQLESSVHKQVVRPI